MAPLAHHSFLYRITASGETTSRHLFHEVENDKLCENNYNLWKQLQPLTIPKKRFIVDAWEGSEYALGFEDTSILKISGF